MSEYGEYRVGDEVVVISTPPDNKREFPNWVSEMDSMCGKVYKISEKSHDGTYYLSHRNSIYDGFWFIPKWFANNIIPEVPVVQILDCGML